MKKKLKQPYKVAGIGEVLWDMISETKRLGGAPANFALHAQSLGGQTHIISSIGQDNAGLEILQQLSRKQVDTNYIRMDGHPTGWVDVKISKNGQPEYVIHEDVAWDYIQLSSKTETLAKNCDAVCFGSLAQRNPISQISIQEFLANTKADCLRVFDINLRQNYYSKDIIESSLQTANVLKLNDDELMVLQVLIGLPASTELALQTLLTRYELDFLAFTQGAAGSIMMDKENVSHCPSVPVDVKDTIGAGDSFTATMVMGKLYGLPLENINQLASKVAAFVCSQVGATPTLPAHIVSELKEEMPISTHEIVDTLSVQKIKKQGFRKASQSTL